MNNRVSNDKSWQARWRLYRLHASESRLNEQLTSETDSKKVIKFKRRPVLDKHMPLDDPAPQIQRFVREIQGVYPDSRIVHAGSCSLDDPAIMFIKEQTSPVYTVRFYAHHVEPTVSCHIKADFYAEKSYRYSLLSRYTLFATGRPCDQPVTWQERLRELEDIVQLVVNDGLGAVDSLIGTQIGMVDYEPSELIKG